MLKNAFALALAQAQPCGCAVDRQEPSDPDLHVLCLLAHTQDFRVSQGMPRKLSTHAKPLFAVGNS